MKLKPTSPTTEIHVLDHGALADMGDRCARVDCLHGSIWITLDAERQDIVLDAGQSLEVSKRGRCIVYALERSRFRTTGPAIRAPHPAWTALIDAAHRLVDAARAFQRGQAHRRFTSVQVRFRAPACGGHDHA